MEYATWLGIDLEFQGFAEELESLPGKYRAPQGQILLAVNRDSHEAAGCVAMRPHSPERCEMKRLWVRESYRGIGLGRDLVTAIVGEAAHAGYREMVLDTLSTMVSALGLYKSCGFHPTEPYYDNPLPGAVYLSRRL